MVYLNLFARDSVGAPDGTAVVANLAVGRGDVGIARAPMLIISRMGEPVTSVAGVEGGLHFTIGEAVDDG